MADDVAHDGDRLARIAGVLGRDEEAVVDAFDADFGHVKNSQYWSGVLTRGLPDRPHLG